MKKLRLLLVAVLAFTMLAGTVAQAEDAEPITITFLHCWNGGGANFPSDQVNNLVAQKLLEETGVIMQMESLVTSELEKLNTMFASGVLPDLVNAPYWSTTGGEGEVIKDAASQGLLYDIKDSSAGLSERAEALRSRYRAGLPRVRRVSSVLQWRRLRDPAADSLR